MNKKYFSVLLIGIQSISLQVFAELNSSEKSLIFIHKENDLIQAKKSNIDFFADRKNQEALFKRQKYEDFIKNQENFSNTANMGKDEKIKYYLKNNDIHAIQYITNEVNNSSDIRR